MKKYISEFIGTAMMMVAGCLASVAVNIMVTAIGFSIPMALTTTTCALAFGLGTMAAYYCFSDISGAHLNPAVSLANLIAGSLSAKKFFGYVAAQLLGALLGVGITALVLGDRTTLFASGYDSYSTFGSSVVAAAAIEVVMTFVFVYVFLAVSRKEELKTVSGLIIGLAFAMTYMVEIPVTGGGANPAKSFATALLQSNSESLTQLWIFIIAPLLGAAVAALVYIFLNSDDSKEEIEESDEDDEETDEAEEPEGETENADSDVESAETTETAEETPEEE